MTVQAWFSALGEPLGEAERAEIAAYLAGLAMVAPGHAVSSWQEAGGIYAQPAAAWWDVEEREANALGEKAKLPPADSDRLRLDEALHGAYQARLAQAAGAPAAHPFLRKYALYCGGRWPLGVYGGRFAIF